ncbi:hypothetical protein [Methanoplanus endosymbiosus]|uniref:Uncharacterized protein n=1 Tax=Methanoplanus endosymbiosus TaxID=33865 RepID=A0A9E7PL88_9EURY|nr:hypothetical protein [Methanoplanus endosymbiosus]UUX92243.1 hypothetical protein L6E24_12965 [Methanoplanus endosymbiosus]
MKIMDLLQGRRKHLIQAVTQCLIVTKRSPIWPPAQDTFKWDDFVIVVLSQPEFVHAKSPYREGLWKCPPFGGGIQRNDSSAKRGVLRVLASNPCNLDSRPS